MTLRLGTSFFSGCTIPLTEFLDMCNELKMKYIEIQLEPPYFPSSMTQDDKETLRNLISDSSLIPLVHAPYDDVNLASLKEPIRRASLGIMKDCIDISSEIGSSSITIHAGSCPSNQIARHEDAIQRFRASLLELVMYAHDSGVRIGVENKQVGKDREIILFPKEHLEVVQDYSDFDVGAVLDIGHANTTGVDLVEYIKIMKSYLLEVHLHDNDGTADLHLGLGDGTADLKTVIQELRSIRYHGPVILELDTREHLENAIRFIQDI
ncbi:MAG: sugar phosphate isomerase/epimerase family protein [Candidatus Thorarchaeota archaeon]